MILNLLKFWWHLACESIRFFRLKFLVSTAGFSRRVKLETWADKTGGSCRQGNIVILDILQTFHDIWSTGAISILLNFYPFRLKSIIWFLFFSFPFFLCFFPFLSFLQFLVGQKAANSCLRPFFHWIGIHWSDWSLKLLAMSTFSRWKCLATGF